MSSEWHTEHVPTLPQPPDANEDRLHRHVGEWVAVRDGRLLVADADPAVVVAWLRERAERAEQLYRVPGCAQDIATEHGLCRSRSGASS